MIRSDQIRSFPTTVSCFIPLFERDQIRSFPTTVSCFIPLLEMLLKHQFKHIKEQREDGTQKMIMRMKINDEVNKVWDRES